MSSPPSSPPTPRPQSDALAAWGVAVLVVATVLLGALLPARNAPPPRQAHHGHVAEDPGCLEWSDGCRVCQRLAEGPACSLPGIACTPAEPRCLRRAGG